MKGLFKSRLFFFILGIIVCGSTAYAFNIASKDVSYDNTTSGSEKNNVQEAVDDLYSKYTGLYDKAYTDGYNAGYNPTIQEILTPTFYGSYVASQLSATGGAVKESYQIRLPSSGAIQYGPYISLSSGCYLVLVNGVNLNNTGLVYTTTANNGTTRLFTSNASNVVRYNNYAYYYVKLTTSYSNVEFLVTNGSSTQSIVKSVLLFSGGSC